MADAWIETFATRVDVETAREILEHPAACACIGPPSSFGPETPCVCRLVAEACRRVVARG